MGKGNGGAAGEIAFPSYLETDHQSWIDLSGANTLSQSAVSLVNTLISTQNPYNAYTLTDPETDLDAIKTRYDTVETALDALDPQTDWEGLVEKSARVVDNSTVAIIDDAAIGLVTVRNNADDALSAALQKISGTPSVLSTIGMATTEWNELVNAAVAKVDTVGILSNIDISALLGDVRSGASSFLSAVTAAVAQATSPTPTTNYNSYVDEAATLRDISGYVDKVVFATILSNRQTTAGSEVSSAKSAATSAVLPTPASDWDGYIDQAKTTRDLADYIDKIDFTTILSAMTSAVAGEVTAAINAADAAIQSAVTEALDAVSSGVLTTLATKVEAALATDRANRKRRFTGGMADINAVHSSAFLFGLALIDSEQGRELEATMAERTAAIYAAILNGVYTSALRLRADILQGFIGTNTQADLGLMGMESTFLLEGAKDQAGLRRLQGDLENSRYLAQLDLRPKLLDSLLGHNIEADRANMLMQSDFLIRAAAAMVDLRRQVAQVEIAREQLEHQGYLRAYEGGLRAEVEQEVTNKRHRHELLQQGVEAMVRIMIAAVELEQSAVGVWSELFRPHISQELDQEVFNKTARYQLVRESQQLMGRIYLGDAELKLRTVQALSEAQRALVIGRAEYEAQDLEVNVKDSTWDLDMLLLGSGILSAITGNSGYVPRGPSKAASALGGALQGAGAGAALGGPIGAGVGAVVGLLEGLAQ